MRPISVLLLALITLAVTVGAVFVSANRQGAVEVAKGERLFPGLGGKFAQAQSIEIDGAGGKARLTRVGDGWTIADKDGYPARPEAVRRLLAAVAELETVEAKTRNPALLERLDLADLTVKDSKASQVQIKDAQGAVIAGFLIGKKRPTPLGAQPAPQGQEMLYVRKIGDNQSWLAMGQIELRRNVIDWADKAVIDLAPTRFRSVLVARPDAAGFTLTRAAGDSRDFALDGLPEGAKLKSQFDVNSVSAALEGLTFEDVAKAPAEPITPYVSVVWTAEDGLTVTLKLIKRDDQSWASIAASGPGAEPINAKTAAWIYKLPDWKREKLESTRDSLIEKPAS
jgi:hypothetical protein